MLLLQLPSLSTVSRSFKRKWIDLRVVTTFRWKCGQTLGNKEHSRPNEQWKLAPLWRHWKEALQLNDDKKKHRYTSWWKQPTNPEQQVGWTELSRDVLLRSISSSISSDLLTGAVSSHTVSHCATVLTRSRSSSESDSSWKTSSNCLPATRGMFLLFFQGFWLNLFKGGVAWWLLA